MYGLNHLMHFNALLLIHMLYVIIFNIDYVLIGENELRLLLNNHRNVQQVIVLLHIKRLKGFNETNLILHNKILYL